MEHGADELDCWWFVWVLLLEVHDKPKGTILEGRVGWSDDDSVPDARRLATKLRISSTPPMNPHQVMTLSATGDADTPAGGSVCIRCEDRSAIPSLVVCSLATNLEVSHQTTTSGGRHLGRLATGREGPTRRTDEKGGEKGPWRMKIVACFVGSCGEGREEVLGWDQIVGFGRAAAERKSRTLSRNAG